MQLRQLTIPFLARSRVMRSAPDGSLVCDAHEARYRLTGARPPALHGSRPGPVGRTPSRQIHAGWVWCVRAAGISHRSFAQDPFVDETTVVEPFGHAVPVGAIRGVDLPEGASLSRGAHLIVDLLCLKCDPQRL